jgi:sugar lactone lactonase YvrE
MTIPGGLMAFLAAAALLGPPEAAGQAVAPGGAARQIIDTQCTGCHALSLVTEKRASRGEWEEILGRMSDNGASLAPDDTPAVLDYLAANFGPAAAGAAPAGGASDRYEVDTDWARLPEGMTWDASTTSIAADGRGQVVVLVRTAPYFRVFTRDGEFVRAWGDAALFGEAHSVMFDRDGNLWATDSNGHVVYKFSPDGALLMTLGTRGVAGDNVSRDLFNRPNAVAIAVNGDIYVSDGYVNSRIVHFTSGGEFVRIIGGTAGSEPGQLQLPHGVVVDSRGRVIVGDSDNGRVSVFDAGGGFVEIWPVPSRGGMLITSDDTVYVSDVAANAIHVIREGVLVETIGGLGRVHNITLDSDGVIYAADSLNRTVMKVTPRD